MKYYIIDTPNIKNINPTADNVTKIYGKLVSACPFVCNNFRQNMVTLTLWFPVTLLVIDILDILVSMTINKYIFLN